MAFYAEFRHVRAYSSLRYSVPVGVALWGDGYVGFRAVPADEPLRNLDTDSQPLVQLAADKIRSWVESRCAPHTNEPGDPTTLEWWNRVRLAFIHSVDMSEPRAIDLPASDAGLVQLYNVTLLPFRIPAVLPSHPRTEMYAELRDGGYCHIYPAAGQVHMCGPKGPIHKVLVQPDANGTHWGWWDAEHQYFTLVWPHRVQLEICFAYGSQAEIKRGRGLCCQLSVTKIADAE